MKQLDQTQKDKDILLRERCIELAIRSDNYGHSAVAKLADRMDKNKPSLTASAKRIFNFIKTGR